MNGKQLTRLLPVLLTLVGVRLAIWMEAPVGRSPRPVGLEGLVRVSGQRCSLRRQLSEFFFPMRL